MEASPDKSTDASLTQPLLSEQLLPLVYDELRRLAARRLALESPGQTLQPTALVHEAYFRLVSSDRPQRWESRGHFFAAAGQAMRRILIERARRRQTIKHGGGCTRVNIDLDAIEGAAVNERLIALDQALTKLAEVDPRKANLVELRFFSGLTLDQAAVALGISVATANRDWSYARVWLMREMAMGDMDFSSRGDTN